MYCQYIKQRSRYNVAFTECVFGKTDARDIITEIALYRQCVNTLENCICVYECIKHFPLWSDGYGWTERISFSCIDSHGFKLLFINKIMNFYSFI